MRSSSILFACGLGLVALTGPARAETIGVASQIVRTVLESTGDAFAPLAEGDTLFRDQRIRSGHDGSALLTLEDASVVAVGPSSEVVLDAFVAPGNVRGVSVARGVFRFISGPAAPAGPHYIVKTPHASIAVRGTTFDVRVLDGMTTVVLHEGAVDVCRRDACRSLRPGSSVDVTSAGIYPTAIDRDIRWTFLTGASPGMRRLADAAAVARAAMASAPAPMTAAVGSGAGGSRGNQGGATPGQSAGGQASAGGTPANQADAGSPAGDGTPAGSGYSTSMKTSSAPPGGLSVKMRVQ